MNKEIRTLKKIPVVICEAVSFWKTIAILISTGIIILYVLVSYDQLSQKLGFKDTLKSFDAANRSQVALNISECKKQVHFLENRLSIKPYRLDYQAQYLATKELKTCLNKLDTNYIDAFDRLLDRYSVLTNYTLDIQYKEAVDTVASLERILLATKISLWSMESAKNYKTTFLLSLIYHLFKTTVLISIVLLIPIAAINSFRYIDTQ